VSSPAPADGRRRMRRLMLIRLAFLVPLLVAVFLLHVSGTALVAVHIARPAIPPRAGPAQPRELSREWTACRVKPA
jgi:hypothetical protein